MMKCEICDRAECKRAAEKQRVDAEREAVMSTAHARGERFDNQPSDWLSAANAYQIALVECNQHCVNWRARAERLRSCDENAPGFPCGACISCLRAQVELRDEQLAVMLALMQTKVDNMRATAYESDVEGMRWRDRACEWEAQAASLREALAWLWKTSAVVTSELDMRTGGSFTQAILDAWGELPRPLYEMVPAALSADAGKLAAEVLRTADEYLTAWEDFEMKPESKQSNEAYVQLRSKRDEARARFHAAVRARRGVR